MVARRRSRSRDLAISSRREKLRNQITHDRRTVRTQRADLGPISSQRTGQDGRCCNNQTLAPASRPTDDATFGYSPALDGLRAFAVAAVVLFHAGVGGLNGGFLGVDAFFVLSGFLITSLLLAEHVRDRPHQARRVLGPPSAAAAAGAAHAAGRGRDRRPLPARQRRPQAAAHGRPRRARLRRELADDLARHRIRRRHRHPVAAAAHVVAGHRGTVLRAVAADHRGSAGRGWRPAVPAGSCSGVCGAGAVGSAVLCAALYPARRRQPRLLRHRHAGPGAADRRGAGRDPAPTSNRPAPRIAERRGTWCWARSRSSAPARSLWMWHYADGTRAGCTTAGLLVAAIAIAADHRARRGQPELADRAALWRSRRSSGWAGSPTASTCGTGRCSNSSTPTAPA